MVVANTSLAVGEEFIHRRIPVVYFGPDRGQLFGAKSVRLSHAIGRFLPPPPLMYPLFLDNRCNSFFVDVELIIIGEIIAPYLRAKPVGRGRGCL